MSRKPVALLLFFALIVPMLAACAGAPAAAPAAAPTSAPTTAPASTPAGTSAASPAGTPSSAPVGTPAAAAPRTTPSTAPGGAIKTTWSGTINWYQFGYTPGGRNPTNKVAEDAVATFEKANPGLKVKIVGVPFEGGQQKLDTALVAGGNDAPDVFRIASDRLVKYADDRLVAPIDDYLSAEDRADIYPNALGGVEWKGKHYAWPLWVPPMGIYLNPEIFQERNVPLPADTWTYDEFVKVAKQLTFTRADDTPVYGFSAAVQPDLINVWAFLYADGGRVLDQGQYTFDRPEAIAGLQRLADLALVHKVTPPDFGNQKMADVVAAFKDQKTLAMYLAPTVDIATYRKEKVPFEVRFVPLGASGKPVTVGGLGTFAVRQQQDTERLAAAMKFARFLTSKEVADAVPGYYLAPAARKSVPIPAGDPWMQQFGKMVVFTELMPQTPVWGQVSAKVNAQMQAAVAGVFSPEDALKRAGQELKPLLK
ncbi:MAG: sugar ABC transporter substrate-binding protein [Chloroflexi bacterium]|nr:sugar ABC transporter substrate-binding protein [Chloroflexota bacterium]